MLLNKHAELVAPLVLAMAAAGAWACTSNPQPAATLPTATNTAVPCTDETAIGIVRRSVVRISTDEAVGTGVVVDDGQVLTNAHVVEGSDTVRVESQGGVAEGTVVGADRYIDLALVQTDTHSLPPVKFADPLSLTAGQRLLAIGYALDLPGEPSTTGGIFSALRDIDGVHYVQTDAPINPGNSGGPLFTQCGEVVGMNTLSTRTGIGLAIDSSTLRSVKGELALGQLPVRPGITPGVAPTTRSEAPAPTPPPALPPTEAPVQATATPVPAPQPAAICGDNFSVTISEPSQLGRTLHDGDSLGVSLTYDAPGCTSLGAGFSGFALPGSSFYDYWCVEYRPPDNKVPTVCAGGRREAYFSNRIDLLATSGSITIAAQVFDDPPGSPELNLFKLCRIYLTFTDGVFGGRHAERTYDAPLGC